MKRMALTGKSTNVKGTSTKPRKPAASGPRFVACLRNEGYEASLERNKIYAVLPDKEAERKGDVRVVDESGEDYLFFGRSIRGNRRAGCRESLAFGDS
jgi:hypothetical protein